MGRVERPYEEQNLLQTMFTVDYQSMMYETFKFFSDMSFSFLTWRTIEQLESGDVELDDLDDDAIKQISFTILPGGQTVLHKLFQDYYTLEKIFMKSETNISG